MKDNDANDRRDHTSAVAADRPPPYETGKVLGNGSFGVVCEARCLVSGDTVAIKKVLQDPRYKNRELDIMKELKHQNVVYLKDWFYTNQRDEEKDRVDVYLNVVMDYIPETAHRVMKSYLRSNQRLPQLLIKLYTYQMCRALGYLHSMGLCHRDIKPQNLLVDPVTHTLKLCDFGSAKKLSANEASVAYICSRFYRAPELMLGATHYTTSIDIWSIGCVVGELVLCQPLFAGETSVDQLVKIIQVLGTPTQRQMNAMNPNYTEFKFPDVKAKNWRDVFMSPEYDEDFIDVLKGFIKYEPNERIKPLDALAMPWFDELRNPSTRMPDGRPLPPLFNFNAEELAAMSPETRKKLIVSPPR